MKWPTQLVLIRHGESAYNILRGRKSQDPLYQEFQAAYEKDFRSEKARRLALQVRERWALGVNDAATELTSSGIRMARCTGSALRTQIELPHVIFVSPYVRTLETLKHMIRGWSALGTVKRVPEDRIRELEHGLSLLYNDWRVFHVFHPEQKDLWGLMGKYWYQYPQGESVSEVRERIRSFLGTVIREYTGKCVMLITHHLTILSIRAILERLSPEEFIQLDEDEKPVNCGVSIYEGDPNLGEDGRLVLKAYNKRLY